MVHRAESIDQLGQTRALTRVPSSIEAECPARPALPLTRCDLEKPDLSGYQFGSYELGRRLGRGGMGYVFVARHVTLDKPCALKFICPEAQGCAEAVTRFMTEIKALGKLDHPHVVIDFDAGCIGGLHYYVTELLDGYDLTGWIGQRGIPTLGAACEIIRQAALGLAHAHGQRFVHRDVKPANLFLTHQGIVKLLDFGLARHSQVASDLTSTQQLLGTVDYFAPEQAENAQQCTKACDIYSLGLTLVYLLSGHPPYPNERYPTIVSKLRGHMVDRPAWLVENGHNLPPKLLRAIDQMIAKPAVDRFHHCGQIVEALKPWACSEELSDWQLGTQPKVVTLPRPELTWAARHQRTTVALATLLTSLGLWSGWTMLQEQPVNARPRVVPNESSSTASDTSTAAQLAKSPSGNTQPSGKDSDEVVSLSHKSSANARVTRIQSNPAPTSAVHQIAPLSSGPRGEH